jgi:hypothetical protein
MGETGCPGLDVPMHKLDDAIIAHLETRLLDLDRLAALMAQLLDRRRLRCQFHGAEKDLRSP